MNSIRKNIISCAVVLLAAASVGRAQENRDTEFLVWAGGGLSTLSYTMNGGSTGMGFGGFGGMGYVTYFADNFGVKLGIELMSFSGKVNTSSLLSNSYDMVNYENGLMRGDTVFLVKLYGFSEKQRAMYINIPIMAHYQEGNFYASLGAKLGLALSSSFSNRADSIVTSAYANDVNYFYTKLPEYGFAIYPNHKANGNLDFGVNLALAAEMGVVWKLKSKLKLYTGIYADYGLTNLIRTQPSNPVVTFDPALNRSNTFNQSIFYTQSKVELGKATSYVEMVNTFSVGLKVAVGIPGEPRKSRKPCLTCPK